MKKKDNKPKINSMKALSNNSKIIKNNKINSMKALSNNSKIIKNNTKSRSINNKTKSKTIKNKSHNQIPRINKSVPKKLNSSEIIQNTRNNLFLERQKSNDRVKKNLDNMVYWTSITLLAFFNIIACFFLIPFLMFFEGSFLYYVVGTFGFVFGFLFNLLILGIEHLENHHSIIAGIFIPVLAIIDIIVIINIVERLNTILTKTLNFSVSTTILIFVSSFVAPYLLAVILGKHKIK